VKLQLFRDALLQHEQLNFVLTNRLPRHAVTRLMGRVSRIRNPWFTRAAIAIWRLFTHLDLSEAREQRFDSLQACFTRALKEGARTIDPDPDVLVSPCDAIVGACGPVHGLEVFQAKGFPYRIDQLLGDAAVAEPWRDGCFVTLRLTSSMYHRFHAPCAAHIERVTHFSGDTWNVNPIALKRVERLYCLNERAAIRLRTGAGELIAMVPVAAILVASIRLHALELMLHLDYQGPQRIDCRIAVEKGEELGWFEHGSTILLFAPPGFALCDGVVSGQRVDMGRALLRRCHQSAAVRSCRGHRGDEASDAVGSVSP
jgi:phosphatidylserine decarboxylase